VTDARQPAGIQRTLRDGAELRAELVAAGLLRPHVAPPPLDGPRLLLDAAGQREAARAVAAGDGRDRAALVAPYAFLRRSRRRPRLSGLGARFDAAGTDGPP